jgi:biotin carboxyl carrier protein
VTAEQDPLHACAGLTADQLNAVVGLITATDVTELDVTIGTTRLSLRRPASPAPARAELVPRQREPQSLAIASPLVGIFRPSVSLGDVVEQGQPIGAIEALGLPTAVEAPHSGTVQEVVVKSGEPVEYGQPLVILRGTSRSGSSSGDPAGAAGALA